jgi:hypothetical protein
MSRVTRRTVALVAGAALVVAGAGAAFAYWTTSGTGTGTATTGTSTALVVHQTSVVTGLAPGGAPQELSGNFNNSGSPAYVTTVTASIASVTKAAGAVGACTAADYTLTNPVMDVGAQVPSGTGVGSWGVPADVATIQFNNSPTANQDGCQGATVNLAYTIG